MLSTPLTCCSIGVATDCSMVTASAPVNVVLRLICGGMICGNCAMGSPSSDTAPISTVTIAMTIATMGRRMKNAEITSAPLGLGRRAAAAAALAGALIGCGTTIAPSLTFCTPSTTIWSSSLTPDVTIRCVPELGPTSTLRKLHLVARRRPPPASTSPAPGSARCSGTTSALPPASRRRMRTRPYCPGRSRLSGLGNSACSWIVPVVAIDLPVDRDDHPAVRVGRSVGQHQLQLVGGWRRPCAIFLNSACAQARSRPSSRLSRSAAFT